MAHKRKGQSRLRFAKAEESAAKTYFRRAFRRGLRTQRRIIATQWALFLGVFAIGYAFQYFITPAISSTSGSNPASLQPQMPWLVAAGVVWGVLYLGVIALPYLAWVLVCGLRRVPEELRTAIPDKELTRQFWSSWAMEACLVLFLPRMAMHVLMFTLSAFDPYMRSLQLSHAQTLVAGSGVSAYGLARLLSVSDAATALAESSVEALGIWSFVVLGLRLTSFASLLQLGGCIVLIQLGFQWFSYHVWTRIESIRPFENLMYDTWSVVYVKLAIAIALVYFTSIVYRLGSGASRLVWQRVLESRS